MHWRTDLPSFQPSLNAPERLNDPLYFCFLGQQVVVGPVPGVWAPLQAIELSRAGPQVAAEHYLGNLGGRDCLAVDFALEQPLVQDFTLVGLRQLLGEIDEELFYLAGRALQILDWDRTTRFCGRCGSATRHGRNDRSKHCDSCRIPVYPRLSPSIIVLVTRGNEVLLARNAAWGPSGFYSTLAGFVEPGESIEETVHREVFEEVGVRIKNPRYLGSQSWPFPNSLMLGFHAQYESGEFTYHDEEIADAQWFNVEALPNIPGPHAISRWLIRIFLGPMPSRVG